MHKLNNFIDVFNEEVADAYEYINIWLKFVTASSSKVPKTNFKFAMDPSVLAANTNRMALTYISQCAVYHNLPSIKQWWNQNDAGNPIYLDFVRSKKKVLFLGNVSILISEVYMFMCIHCIILLLPCNSRFLYCMSIYK